MKIRRGFVSNSSSSSFIVAFPHKPKSEAELQKMLFGDEKMYNSPYEDMQWTAQAIVEVVWRDLEKQEPSTLIDMEETVARGWITGQPAFDDFCKGDKTDWDAYDAYQEATNKFSHKYAKNFANKHPDATVFSFEYSDNDGDMFSAMEHGTLFDRMPHLRISHH